MQNAKCFHLWILWCDHWLFRMKAAGSTFLGLLSFLLHKVFLTFVSVNKILWCDHSNESQWAVLCCGTVYYAAQGGSNVWVCGRNPMVWPFKWKLLSSTFVFYSKKVWDFSRLFLLSFNWKIRRKMIMSWWVKANFFSVYIGFHRNCASGWDLRRSSSKCSPFTKRCCSEKNAWDNL